MVQYRYYCTCCTNIWRCPSGRRSRFLRLRLWTGTSLAGDIREHCLRGTLLSFYHCSPVLSVLLFNEPQQISKKYCTVSRVDPVEPKRLYLQAFRTHLVGLYCKLFEMLRSKLFGFCTLKVRDRRLFFCDSSFACATQAQQ